MKTRVFNLIITNYFLRVQEKQIDYERYIYIDNEDDAYSYAYEQSEISPTDNGFSKEISVWTDITSHLISELPNQDSFYSIASEIEQLLFAYLPLEIQSVNTEIESDLSLLIASHEAKMSSKFLDDLLFAYECGYWACGWAGNFPKGKLCIAKVPKAEAMGPAQRKRILYIQNQKRKCLSEKYA